MMPDQTLKEIKAQLYPDSDGVDLVEIYSDLARRLSAAVRKQPAWTWRYIESAMQGTVGISSRLAEAIGLLAASLDGNITPDLLGMQALTVYAMPGSVRPNSLILAESRPCRVPGCPIWFVPRVHNQTRCPAHRRTGHG